MARSRLKATVQDQRGAFDLPSIIIGVVVVGILTAGVLATIFGIIPFAQDSGSKQDVAALRTAEAVARTKDSKFLDTAGLTGAGYLPQQAVSAAEEPGPASGDVLLVGSTGKLKAVAGVNAKGDCYVALGKSGSGKIFWGSDKSSDALELTPADDPGCLTPAELKTLVDSIGGFEGNYSPLAPAVKGVTADTQTAAFTWDAVKTATGYRVETRINGLDWTLVQDNQTETTARATAGPSDVIDIRVTARNGAGDSSYGTATVKLPESVIANWGFEAGLKNWSAGTGATASTDTHSGMGSAKLSSVSGTSSLSQSFTVPAESFSTLTFWAKYSNMSYDNNPRSEAQIISATGTVLATPLRTYGTNGAWAKFSADLSSFRGQKVTLQFLQTSQGSYTGTFTIDDVALTSTPPVVTAAPTRVGAAAETGGASLAWVAPASPATNITSYTVTPYLAGVAQTPTTVTGNPAPASATVTGLSNGASYTFTVSATNSAGTSPESAPSEAVTPGPTVIKNVGFEAGFKYWSAGTGATASTDTHSGMGSVKLSSASGTSSLSQSFTVPAESFSTLTFWAKYSNMSYDNNPRSEAQIISATGTVLATPLRTYGTNGTWAKFSTDLSSFKGQKVTIQFLQTSQGSYTGTFTIDDVTVTSTPPPA